MADRGDRRNWRNSDLFTLGIGIAKVSRLYVHHMVYLRGIS